MLILKYFELFRILQTPPDENCHSVNRLGLFSRMENAIATIAVGTKKNTKTRLFQFCSVIKKKTQQQLEFVACN